MATPPRCDTGAGGTASAGAGKPCACHPCELMYEECNHAVHSFTICSHFERLFARACNARSVSFPSHPKVFAAQSVGSFYGRCRVDGVEHSFAGCVTVAPLVKFVLVLYEPVNPYYECSLPSRREAC